MKPETSLSIRVFNDTANGLSREQAIEQLKKTYMSLVLQKEAYQNLIGSSWGVIKPSEEPIKLSIVCELPDTLEMPFYSGKARIYSDGSEYLAISQSYPTHITEVDQYSLANYIKNKGLQQL
jgi:hypothetical protein